MEPARAEARSEWLEFDGSAAPPLRRRVVASTSGVDDANTMPHDATRLLDAHDKKTRLAMMPSTQLLLRKDSKGTWSVFLDGCLSTGLHAPEERTTTHEVPPFDVDALLEEDGTKRKVVAPVAIACIVEEGAQFPDLVRLQVVQRTFVGGRQIDAGHEPVLSECDLDPFAASDPVARYGLLPYPMEVTPPPTIVIVDDVENRNNAAQQRLKNLESSLAGLRRGFWDIVAIANSPAPVVKATLTAVKRVGVESTVGSTLLGSVFAFLAYASSVTLATSEMAATRRGAAFGVGGGMFMASAFFSNALYRFRRRETVQTQEDEAEEKKERKRRRLVRIKFADLPKVIERVAGYGVGVDYQDRKDTIALRESKRHEDAALLEYLNNAYDLNNEAVTATFIELKAKMLVLAGVAAEAGSKEEEKIAERTANGDPFQTAEELIDALLARDDIDQLPPEVQGVVEETQAEARANRQRLVDEYKAAARTTIEVIDAQRKTELKYPNLLLTDGLDFEEMCKEAHIRTVLRVEIIDSGAEDDASSALRSTHVFSATDAEARRAAWYAAGYDAAATELRRVFNNAYEAIDANRLRSRSAAIVQGTAAKTLGKEIIKNMAGYEQDVRPLDRQVYKALLQSLELQTWKIMEDQRPPQPGPSTMKPTWIRRLPQLFKPHRTLSPSGRIVSGDVGVEYAETTDAPMAVASAPLRLAVTNSSQIATAMRRTAAQFIEADGSLRERLRFLIAYDAMPAPAPSANIPKADRREASISTRLFYAPRLPMDVSEALACFERHSRPGHDARVEWLARVPPRADPPYERGLSGSLAEAIGVPATHAGELVAGVYADMVCDDEIARFGDAPESAYDPMGWQLMRGGTEAATARLRAAAELAGHVFAETPPRRLEEDDAFFAAYPGGRDLLRALHECASWRRWVPAWKSLLLNRDGNRCDESRDERLDRLTAAFAAAPRSLASLKQFSKALASAKPMLAAKGHDWRSLPYMCTQSLALGFINPRDSKTRYGPLHQVEHAQRALARLVLLSDALGLAAEHAVALKFEAVCARPILAVWSQARGPGASQWWDVPMPGDPGTDPPVAFSQLIVDVPNVSAYPTDAPIEDILQNRLASLSLSDAMDDERASNGMGIGEAADRLNGDEVQYMVPFGGAALREVAPMVSRALEEAPVFLPLATLPVLPVGGAPFTVTLKAEAPNGAANAMQIGWEKTDAAAATVRFRFARIPSAASSPPPELGPKRYQSLRATVQDVQDDAVVEGASIGAAVDAASAVMWNIERVLQSLIVAATRLPESKNPVVSIKVTAPSLPPVRVEKPPADERPARFDYEKARLLRQQAGLVIVAAVRTLDFQLPPTLEAALAAEMNPSTTTAVQRSDWTRAKVFAFAEDSSRDPNELSSWSDGILLASNATSLEDFWNRRKDRFPDEFDAYQHYKRVEAGVDIYRTRIDGEIATTKDAYDCRNEDRLKARNNEETKLREAWPYIVACAHALFATLGLRRNLDGLDIGAVNAADALPSVFAERCAASGLRAVSLGEFCAAVARRACQACT